MPNYNPVKTIMLVDDDSIALYLIERRLKKDNFCDKVIIYSEAKQALSYLTERQNAPDALPEIIFLDINMPIMDGWAFLERFKEIDFSYRPLVFMLTSSDSMADKLKSTHYPEIVRGYFNKPIKTEDVFSIIQFMDEKRLRKDS